MSAEARPNKYLGIKANEPLDVPPEAARHMEETFRKLAEEKRSKSVLPPELRDLSTPALHYHDSVDQI